MAVIVVFPASGRYSLSDEIGLRPRGEGRAGLPPRGGWSQAPGDVTVRSCANASGDFQPTRDSSAEPTRFSPE